MNDDCRTLWMGDIQLNWDEVFVGSLFGSLGEIPAVKLIRDRVSGYPAGYGFIEFSTIEKANRALTNFNGQVIPGTVFRFRLNWGAGGKRIESDDEYSIFVGDLSSDVSDDLLLTTFASRFASVRGAKVVMDPLTGMTKGFGFVRFGSREESDQALQSMTGVYCGSRPIRVSAATDRRKSMTGGVTVAQYNQAQAQTQAQPQPPQPQPPTKIEEATSVVRQPQPPTTNYYGYNQPYQQYGAAYSNYYSSGSYYSTAGYQQPVSTANYYYQNGYQNYYQQGYQYNVPQVQKQEDKETIKTKDFTKPEDVDFLNEQYIEKKTPIIVPPLPRESVTTFMDDPARGTAMMYAS